MGLDRSLISKIIANVKIHNANNNGEAGDKRRTLTDKDRISIASLLPLPGSLQELVGGA